MSINDGDNNMIAVLVFVNAINMSALFRPNEFMMANICAFFSEVHICGYRSCEDATVNVEGPQAEGQRTEVD